MAKRASPRWVRESEQRVEHFVKQFRDSLRRISLRFAHHRRANCIDAVHVDEAFDALVRVGLKQESWWKRPQLKITVASVFVGAAVACPDFAPLFFDDANQVRIATYTTIFTCGLLGATFYIWGWLQNSG